MQTDKIKLAIETLKFLAEKNGVSFEATAAAYVAGDESINRQFTELMGVAWEALRKDRIKVTGVRRHLVRLARIAGVEIQVNHRTGAEFVSIPTSNAMIELSADVRGDGQVSWRFLDGRNQVADSVKSFYEFVK